MKLSSYKRRANQLKRQGFTLLEVMLALALSFLVLMGVAMAIDLHLRMLDKRQNEIEQSQLSRSVLQLIREDIRGAVQYTPFDSSALDDLIAGLDPLGADAAQAALGGGQSDDGDADDAEPTAEESSSASQTVASSVAPPTRPGVYGNETALMVDVSRLPRRDQLLYPQTLNGAPLLPSDIKTVAYYVGTTQSSASAGTQSGNFTTSGLVRREVDRAVTRYSIDFGGGAALADAEEVIAPEVTSIYFRYFDGKEWQAYWDSDELGRLPVAIEVTVQIGGAQQGTGSTTTNTSVSNSSATNVQNVLQESHTIVVYLPISEAVSEADEEEAAAAEAAAAGTTGS